jgi:cytochrome P450
VVDDFTYDPFSPENTADPYPVYQAMLEHAPVYRNDERRFWALTRYDDVRSAILDWQHFSSAEGVRIDDLLELAGPSPLTMDPPRHGVLRNVVRRPFAPRETRALTDRVTDIATALLHANSGRAQFDAVTEFAKLLPVKVIATMMGVADEDTLMLKGWADQMLETVPGVVGTPDAARTAAVNMREYWTDQLRQRGNDDRQDIIASIAAAEVDGDAIGLDEQIGMCNLVFEAGNATTGTLIANALHALATFEAQREWLIANPDLMPQAIEEFLRFESPVQSLLRVTRADLELHDRTIPAGETVLLVLGAANRDPRVWDRPDTLELSRAVQSHLAFGEGIHHCLGAPLARLEAPIAVSLFLETFPNYVVSSVERFHDVSMRTLKSLVVEPGAAVPVR